MPVLLFDVFNDCSSSIKEINRLIWKECQTFTIEKNWRSQNFEMHNFEEQKGPRYIWGNGYIGIIVFSCLSSTKMCLRFLLNSFVQETKGFDQSSLRWGWIQEHKERFPNYLG